MLKYVRCRGHIYNALNTFSNNSHYNGARDDYSYGEDNHYQYNESRNRYDGGNEKTYQNEQKQVDESNDSSETAIRRHFDKFKK